MSKLKSDQPAKRIADVANPNDSLPSTNSKSVIISSRPIMRDPMMAATPPASEASADSAVVKPIVSEATKPALASVSHELLLIPPTDSELPSVEAIADVTPPKPTTEPMPAPTAESVIPAVVKTDPTNPDADEAQQIDAETERLAGIDKLIESQKYFLPVDAVELKRAHRFYIVGIVAIVLLGLLFVDIALDAGLVHISGLRAVTHFFSN